MRRIPLSRRSHIIGFQPLATGTAEHESALERDFVTRTSFLHPAAVIVSQPLTLRFDSEGRCCRYTPDFLVRDAFSRTRLIEIKYRADLRENWTQYRPRFDAARAWAKDNGGTFRVVTERFIRDAALENAKRLLPLRQSPLDVRVAMTMLDTARAAGVSTIRALVESVPGQRPLALATLWKLIARRAICVEPHAPITFESPVTLP